jgi:hypothetical protein
MMNRDTQARYDFHLNKFIAASIIFSFYLCIEVRPAGGGSNGELAGFANKHFSIKEQPSGCRGARSGQHKK